MWITIFDERVVIDLAQRGWSTTRIAKALAASVMGLASWCHVFWMAPPMASITPFSPRFTGSGLPLG